MLRIILRNVQYYLLFFSTVLVLLAFQRLQWYDQGWSHPYAFVDLPMHGGGRYSMITSPDNAGRIYYGGDESKEIGLFKFRLGLFKFVLPTFSKDEASWERTSEFMTVPPPPNKRRKSIENQYLRVKAQSMLHSKHGEERGANGKGETPKSSVAYVVIIPRLPHASKLPMASKSKGIKEGELSRDDYISFSKRAKVLSQSIERAHANSSYEYQLYALNLNSASAAGNIYGGVDDNSEEVREAQIQSGFKTINTDKSQLNGIANMLKFSVKSNEQQPNLIKLLTLHDVIVQISLGSFLLKPMDDLFDVLLRGYNTDNAIDTIGVKRGPSGVGDKSDEQPKHTVTKSTQIDSFSLESPGSSTIENELFIFKSSSRPIATSYLKNLECMLSNQPKGEQGSSQHVINNENLKLRPEMVRKNQEILPGSTQHEFNKAQCERVQTDNNSLWLDRCLYDVGNVNFGDTACNHVSIKHDSRVAHFSTESARISEVGEAQMSPNSAAGQGKDQQCINPWECSSLEDCSKENAGHSQERICTWLHSEWFHLAKN